MTQVNIMKLIKNIPEIRRRIRSGEYIVTPDKPPAEMTEREALEWEKACCQSRLIASEDPKRKPGLMMRIQEIERIFRTEKARKAYKKIITGPFETDQTFDEDEGFDEDEESEILFETDGEDEDEDEDEDESFDEDEELKSEDMMIYDLESDPLFD